MNGSFPAQEKADIINIARYMINLSLPECGFSAIIKPLKKSRAFIS
jgi:hypothetical protein